MVKALRAVFGWAVQPGVELATYNPAKDVLYLEAKGDGHHSWTDAEVAQFEQRHPIGTKARLALSLLVFTGQRRSDIVLFGPQHENDGWLQFTQQKNKDRNPITLQIPIRPELQAVLDASPLGEDTFLVNKFGRPFTANGFGNWFRERCDEAGLKTAHRMACGRRQPGFLLRTIAAVTRLWQSPAIRRSKRSIATRKRLSSACWQRRHSMPPAPKKVPLSRPTMTAGQIRPISPRKSRRMK